MADYDNTNSGAMFSADNMKLLRQGKVNVNGVEDDYIIVQATLPSGQNIFEVYQKVGALFTNEKRTERDPDISGTIKDKASGEWRMSGWKKTSSRGSSYTSIGIRPPKEMAQPTSPVSATPQQAGPDADPTPPIPPVDDEIPF